MWIFVALGLGAGVLTTVSGLGGGQLLMLALAALLDPRLALVISAPALLVGNIHRFSLYRQYVEKPVARGLILGALPGSILGGLVVVGLPRAVLHALLVGTTALAIARALKWWRPTPPKLALPLIGAFIGAVCATSAGAGLVLAPVLLASGLSGRAYLATAALCASAMHLGRITGYATAGLFTRETLVRSAVVAGAILVGNLLGDRIRNRLPESATTWVEYGAMIACVILALCGL